MGGQILGGGAIALVVAVLWLVYLLPSWQMKARYNAAERNAVRLNQALRVLAESSETPGEVRVELSRREAAKHQRLVRRLEAEEDRLRAQYDEAEVERRRREHEAKLERTKQDAEAERFQRALAAEDRRREVAAMRADPRVRRARARRRVRLAATMLAIVGAVALGIGAWQLSVSANWTGVVIGAVSLLAAGLVLRQMVAVAARATHSAASPAESRVSRERVAAPILDPADRGWTPRRLPAPLTATAGSQAAGAVDAANARDRLVQAAREDAARERIARRRDPVPLVARDAPDEEIEQHVRELLARRAAS